MKSVSSDRLKEFMWSRTDLKTRYRWDVVGPSGFSNTKVSVKKKDGGVSSVLLGDQISTDGDFSRYLVKQKERKSHYGDSQRWWEDTTVGQKTDIVMTYTNDNKPGQMDYDSGIGRVVYDKQNDRFLTCVGYDAFYVSEEMAEDMMIPHRGRVDGRHWFIKRYYRIATDDEKGKYLHEKGNPPIGVGFHIHDTLIHPDVFNSLSPSKQEQILELKKEYESIHIVRPAYEIGPNQWARMSQKERDRIGSNLVRGQKIEDEVRKILKSDEQINKEKIEEDIRKASSRKIQIDRQIHDMMSFGIGKNGKLKPTYQKVYDMLMKEMEEINKILKQDL